MIGHDEILARLLDPGLLPVIRTDTAADVMPVCEALVAGGVTALEITLTVPNALECIGEAAKHFAPDVITGAGSVTTPEMCRAAIDAGAVFIVTPIMRPEIARVAKAAGCAVVLGAFTPTEAQSAYEAGADLVKIFPADNPSFIKALRAPLPHLKVVPTGGVSLHNAPEFLAAGCVALGVGSQLVSAKILREKNWPELTRLTREFVEVLRRCRKP
jgi:2-dehydro-3-deoxyphosphogluconate aldolase/(4S)-4-hydroxy-2-oxoglutarate aldolase